MLRRRSITESQRTTRMLCDVRSLLSAFGPELTGLVDPDTQIPFPLHIAGTSASSPALSLVGLGVRKVSFLRVKVYSVGFYLEDSLTSRLRDIPGWSVSLNR